MRLELAEIKAEVLRPRAEANRAEFHGNQYTGGQFQKSEKVQPTINTTAEVAKSAGVSIDTAAKYKRVMSDARRAVLSRPIVSGVYKHIGTPQKPLEANIRGRVCVPRKYRYSAPRWSCPIVEKNFAPMPHLH